MKYLKFFLCILTTAIFLCGLKSDIYAGVTCPDNSTCPDNTYCRLKPDGKFDCPNTSGIKIGTNYTVDNPVSQFSTPADIINKLIPYLFTFAGIALLTVLIGSGFSYLTSGGDEKKVSQAKEKITGGLIGFIILFASYWLTQIVEYLFHIKIF